MSVHNEYTGYTLKHLLLRPMYNLSLPTDFCSLLSATEDLALYCVVLYIAACVDTSRMVFLDRSYM